MDATDLIVWGVVVHLIADWLLQNEWMAINKVSLKHPAAWVHSGIHFSFLVLVFPLGVAALVALTHLLIDTRKPVAWLANAIGQTPPLNPPKPAPNGKPWVDLGMEVRIWVDQAWHITVIAIAAGLVA